MTGRVIRQSRITRADLRANPGRLYVFGDNMAQAGLGGQAREMRGEPNAVGIPTKWSPSMAAAAFFMDAALDDSRVLTRLRDAFTRLEVALAAGCDVVIPADGIGTGLAQLPTLAPRLHRMLEARIAGLAAP